MVADVRMVWCIVESEECVPVSVHILETVLDPLRERITFWDGPRHHLVATAVRFGVVFPEEWCCGQYSV